MHVCAGINALLKLPLLTCIAVEIPVGHTAMIIRPDFNMHYHPKRRSILSASLIVIMHIFVGLGTRIERTSTQTQI